MVSHSIVPFTVVEILTADYVAVTRLGKSFAADFIDNRPREGLSVVYAQFLEKRPTEDQTTRLAHSL
jgi:hypothetical protein